MIRPVFLALLAGAVAHAQPIDTSRALSALRDAHAACTADAGMLWGKSLCGPIAIVDRQTRLAIANDTVAGTRYLPYAGAYVTTVPANRFIANTSFPWGGRQWTMVAMPLPADRYARVTLVMHEVFHREQQALGLSRPDAPNNHLDFRDGRTWLRLEYRALADAVAASDDASRKRHTEAVLLFRARRHGLYPGADTLEALLEMQEGIPEYTGHVLAARAVGEGQSRLVQHVRGWDQTRSTYVRGFAYGTGPALGVLLDRFDPQWRTKVRERSDVAGLLASAIGWRPPRDVVRQALQRATSYGWTEVDSAERARDSTRAPMMREYRARFVDGPTIALAQTHDSLSWGFDPNSLIAFDREHAIYPFGSFTAPWGALNVSQNGVLVRNDLLLFRVSVAQPLETTARQLTGDGWTLQLNAGWSVRPDPSRPGSYVVSRE